MAKLTIPVMCYRCRGAKVLYRSALGDYAKTEFRPAELVQLAAAGALASVQCPVCTGRGVVDVLARN